MNEVVLQSLGLCIFVLIIMMVIKLNSFKWAGFVLCMRDNRNACRVLVRKPERRKWFVRLRLRRKNNIEMYLQVTVLETVDWIYVAQEKESDEFLRTS